MEITDAGLVDEAMKAGFLSFLSRVSIYRKYR